MTNYTPAQLEAFTKPYPAKPLILGGNASMDHYETTVWERTVEAMLKRRAEAAPDLARLVLEKDKEIARLKGLAWIAFHEFNAINARSGGPLDHYGMVTVTHEYWQAITDLFAKAAGETTPWPTENAKAIFEEINRQAMKETSDE